MDCKLIKLSYGENYSNVEVHESEEFEGFIKITDLRGKVRLVNKNIVTIICPEEPIETKPDIEYREQSDEEFIEFYEKLKTRR